MKLSFKTPNLKIVVDHATKQSMANAIRMNLIRQGMHIETLQSVNFDDIVEDVLSKLPGKMV